jgi:hypothetical protein
MRILTVIALSGLLAACAGGGGGGSSGSNGNVTTTASGFSGQSTWTSNGSGTVTSIGTWNQATSGLTYTETVNASNIVQSNSFTSSAGTTVSFNRANGDTIQNIGTGPLANKAYYEIKPDLSDVAFIASGSLNGWSYQAYGVWITGYNSSSGTVGAGSAGTLTVGSAIPTSGTVTFTGNSAGTYTSSSGTPYLTAANMTATTNFATRNIQLATTGTSYLNSSGTYTSISGLNLTGNAVSYSAGVNSISLPVTTAGGGGVSVMTGTATGKFYGPTATEIGGTFAVRTGGGVESFAGAFGGKR